MRLTPVNVREVEIATDERTKIDERGFMIEPSDDIILVVCRRRWAMNTAKKYGVGVGL